MLEKVSRMALLKDFYGPLLTERQQEVLALHYEQDMSYAEIGAELGISRQGVYDLAHRGERLLESYEAKLGLAERFTRHRQELLKLQRLLEVETPGPEELAAAQALLRELSELLM